jgi:hypothetical protein
MYVNVAVLKERGNRADTRMSTPHLIELFFGLALLFGVLMTLPIGGAPTCRS